MQNLPSVASVDKIAFSVNWCYCLAGDGRRMEEHPLILLLEYGFWVFVNFHIKHLNDSSVWLPVSGAGTRTALIYGPGV